MNTRIFELTPICDKAKSFYNKAEVKEFTVDNKKELQLYSYNTLVCTIKNSEKIELNKNIDESLLFSQTTLRHIKEFLKQFYYFSDVKITKADLMKL